MIETRIKFIEKVPRTSSLVSFRFSPKEKVDFLPGQFLQVIFDKNNRGDKNLNKYLSFSCAPGKGYIEVTKKLSDSVFSSRLNSLKKNDEVLIRAPMGKCTLYDLVNDKICFLVGGIGITPVISILEDVVSNEIKKNIILLYGNWKENDIAFKDELDAWNKTKENIKVIHVLAEGPLESKNYEVGLINKEIVQKHVPDIKTRSCFVFGPPKMVEAMKEMCAQMGIDQKNLMTESFLGY